MRSLRRLVADPGWAAGVIRPHHVIVRVTLERAVATGSEESAATAAEEVAEEISRRLPGLAGIEVVRVEPIERRRGERRER